MTPRCLFLLGSSLAALALGACGAITHEHLPEYCDNTVKVLGPPVAPGSEVEVRVSACVPCAARLDGDAPVVHEHCTLRRDEAAGRTEAEVLCFSGGGTVQFLVDGTPVAEGAAPRQGCGRHDEVVLDADR